MLSSGSRLPAMFVALILACSNVGAVHHVPLVPHHVQKTRRSLLSSGLRRRSLQQQVGALYQGYGTHYVDLWVGTPPQRQTVIVDTGSGVTAFPCSACADCGETHHTDKYFIEAESSTFFKVPCNECKRGRCRSDNNEGECKIGMSYQEGSSWSAYEGRDMSYVGGPHDEGLEQGSGKKKKKDDLDPTHANRFAFELMFGCQTKLTGLFKTQLADGIMGMDNAASSFWVQAHEANVIKKRNFSLCFARQPTATRGGTEAGALTMGGFDPRLHHDTDNGMVYTPMADGRSGFFSVHIRKIYLREGGGGDSARSTDPNLKILPLAVSESTLNTGHIIVDSGTTDTYFSRRIQDAFNEAWKQFSDKPYSHNPVSLTEQELNSLPTILFQLQGDEKMNAGLGDPNEIVGMAGDFDPENPHDLIIAMPPSHYMEWDEKEQKYVARFYTDEGSGSVLGANAMMGHDVNFDVENTRIGWAESNCDYTRLVNEHGSEFTLPEEQVEVVKKEEEPEESEEEEVEEKKKPNGGKNPLDALHAPITAAKLCTDITCRAGVAAAFVGLLLVVLLVARRIRSRRRNRVAYHAAELEVANLSSSFHDDDVLELDPEDFGRYRDHPESEEEVSEGSDADVADEGVGYEDEPDTRDVA